MSDRVRRKDVPDLSRGVGATRESYAEMGDCYVADRFRGEVSTLPEALSSIATNCGFNKTCLVRADASSPRGQGGDRSVRFSFYNRPGRPRAIAREGYVEPVCSAGSRQLCRYNNGPH